MAIEEVKGPGSTCTLPYPDRYHTAVRYVSSLPAGSSVFSDEARLVFYALQQQASAGPCKEAKPWSWNPVENAKWQSWKSLGNMAPMEAMRLYVRTLEEEQPDWYMVHKKCEDEGAQSSAGSPQSTLSFCKEGVWVPVPPASQRKPLPRYEHSAVLVGEKIYVYGGNYGGRYLNDVWTFDVGTREWSSLVFKNVNEESSPTSLPPCAGHSMVYWRESLYVVGGHVKAKDGATSLQVKALHVKSLSWSFLDVLGDAPSPRGGHSCTLVGNKILLFGGEDAGRRALGDLFVFDLESLTWSQPTISGKPPPARSAHAAACYKDRYVLIFGGGSVAMCFNDFFVLDTQTWQWSKPNIIGAKPTPRAGHAASMLGDAWYIVGGGNNVKGCTDMLAFDLAVLDEGNFKCLVQASIPLRDPLSSEGISLQSLAESKSLIAFGGYNGKYQNSVSIFKAPPLPPVDESSYVSVEPKDVPTTPKTSTKEVGLVSDSKDKDVGKPAEKPKVAEAPVDLKVQLEIARKEAESAMREASAAKETAAHELALMRRQLTAAQTALAETQKALEEMRAQLSEEESKKIKREAEFAELQKKLAGMQELEKELEKYRRQDKEREAKKGTGIWGYIAG